MNRMTPAQRARNEYIKGTFVAKMSWWMAHCEKCQKETPHMDAIGGRCEFCRKKEMENG
jgi:hypothetical protein